ncbi:hypothetical protein BD626DRAFT_625772 [Schizophyllum amplum]|uniref:Uncharacterized protein n=1 Tax=Schizophyllum amplum TaxID=97359 RepID=A0A550D0R2_9AGAR|nr:hypothetical protein BD626DRAFT_625772 [Auriculariopsis ampla]
MSVPLRNAYVVVWIDPLETLQHLDDEEVKTACRTLVCGKYVATIAGGMYPAYQIDFLVQGLPQEELGKHFLSAMSCPVLPNTSHPEGRRPVKPVPPLPWPDCYHRARCRDTVEFRFQYSKDRNPQSYLNHYEFMLLDQYLHEDRALYETWRDSEASDNTPPAHQQSSMTRLTIAHADEQYTDHPEWEDMPSESELDEQEAAHWQAVLQRSDAADEVEEDESLGSSYTEDEYATEGSGSEAYAEDEPEAPPVNDFDMLAPTNEHENDGVMIRMVVHASYDLSLVDSPSDPAGYFREMEAIAQIVKDFNQRKLRNIEQVKRQDEEYMASLVARSSSKAPDAASSEVIREAQPKASKAPEQQDDARKASVEHSASPSVAIRASEVSCKKSTAKGIGSHTHLQKKATKFMKTISFTLKRAITRFWPGRDVSRSQN